jgi:hypothetical protein
VIKTLAGASAAVIAPSTSQTRVALLAIKTATYNTVIAIKVAPTPVVDQEFYTDRGERSESARAEPGFFHCVTSLNAVHGGPVHPFTSKTKQALTAFCLESYSQIKDPKPPVELLGVVVM